MLVRKGAKSERREASTSVFIGVWGLLGSGREGKFSQKLSTGFSLYDVSVGMSGHFRFHICCGGLSGIMTGPDVSSQTSTVSQLGGRPACNLHTPRHYLPINIYMSSLPSILCIHKNFLMRFPYTTHVFMYHSYFTSHMVKNFQTDGKNLPFCF